MLNGISRLRELPKPFHGDELTVSHHNLNVFRIDDFQEALQHVGLLAGSGTACPRKGAPCDGKSHSFVRNSDHQDVDGRLAEVPLRSVHGHFVGGLLRKQVQEEPPERHGIEIVLAKKALNVRR